MYEKIGDNLNIARQTIYDIDGNLFAYELLYRPMYTQKKEVELEGCREQDDAFATLKVIANCQLMGLDSITNGKLAFINFGHQLLLNKIPTFFPSASIGIEILERVNPDESLINSCKDLKALGYLIILDDFIYREELRSFVEIADIIKLDFQATKAQERKKIRDIGKPYNIRFLAEKIESKQQYQLALNEKFDYFQGYYLSKPEIISIPNIPGYKVNYLNVLKIINKPHPDINLIEEILKREVSLTYRLLRLINRLTSGKQKISSIRDAIEFFGWKNIKNRLSLIVLSSVGQDKPQSLLNNALIRAKFHELIAIHTGASEYKDTYFLIGMLSMLDIFLKQPIKKIVENLPLESEVKDALIGKKNRYYDLIMLTINYENNEKKAKALAKKLGIEEDKLNEIYLEAIEAGNSHY